MFPSNLLFNVHHFNPRTRIFTTLSHGHRDPKVRMLRRLVLRSRNTTWTNTPTSPPGLNTKHDLTSLMRWDRNKLITSTMSYYPCRYSTSSRILCTLTSPRPKGSDGRHTQSPSSLMCLPIPPRPQSRWVASFFPPRSCTLRACEMPTLLFFCLHSGECSMVHTPEGLLKNKKGKGENLPKQTRWRLLRQMPSSGGPNPKTVPIPWYCIRCLALKTPPKTQTGHASTSIWRFLFNLACDRNARGPKSKK